MGRSCSTLKRRDRSMKKEKQDRIFFKMSLIMIMQTLTSQITNFHSPYTQSLLERFHTIMLVRLEIVNNFHFCTFHSLSRTTDSHTHFFSVYFQFNISFNPSLSLSFFSLAFSLFPSPFSYLPLFFNPSFYSSPILLPLSSH